MSIKSHFLEALGAGVVLVALTASPAVAAPPALGTLQLVDLTTAGAASTNSEHHSVAPAVSDDGRFVAFASSAQDLLAPTTATREVDAQVYLRDTVTDTTRMISSSGGVPGNKESLDPRISDDGMLVAYLSRSSNLTADSSAGVWQAYVWSALTGASTLVSTSYESPRHGVDRDVTAVDIAGSGNALVYTTEATDALPGDPYVVPRSRAYRVDVTSGATTIVERDPVLSASRPSISSDGRYVGYLSTDAHTSVPTGGVTQAYLMDMATGTADLVSVDPAGRAGTAETTSVDVSGDGRFVAFDSRAALAAGVTNPTGAHVYRRDRAAGATTIAGRSTSGTVVEATGATISADGSLISYSSVDAPPARSQVLVHDSLSGRVRLISQNRLPESGNSFSVSPSLSSSGLYLAWSTLATNLTPDRYPAGSLHSSAHTMLTRIG